MHVTIHLHENEETAVDVLGSPAARPFAALRLGDSLSIYLPGYSAESAQAARILAEQLTQAAAKLDEAAAKAVA